MIYVLIPSTPDRKKRLEKCISLIKKSVCREPIEIVVEENNYEGYVAPMLRMVNRIDGLAFLIGNDVEVKRLTIDNLYRAYIKNFPENDGIVTPVDELDPNSEIAQHPFGHTKTFREIIFPGYFHNFVDREWTDIMKQRGKFAIARDAFITHRHYSRNRNLKDKTYAVGEKSSDKDGRLYYLRRNENYGRSNYER